MKLKKRFLQLGTISIIVILTACGGGNQQKGNKNSEMAADHGVLTNQLPQGSTTEMHKQHNSLANNFTHKGFIILDQQYQPSESTKAELEQVVNAYLRVKDALVNDDADGADKAVSVMSEKVTAVSPTKMEGKGLEAWNNHQALYEAKLKEMLHIKGLENKRSYFSHISEIMYCTIKSFGLKQGNLFAILMEKVRTGLAKVK
jgi:hypothetical protein